MLELFWVGVAAPAGLKPRMEKEEAPTFGRGARREAPGSRMALRGERGAGHFHGETPRFLPAGWLLSQRPVPVLPRVPQAGAGLVLGPG